MKFSPCSFFTVCLPSIDFKEHSDSIHQEIDPNFQYTVFDKNLTSPRKAYYEKYLASRIELNQICLFRTFLKLIALMLSIAIIRIFFFDNIALLQFVLNLAIVGFSGICIHKQVNFSSKDEVNNYTILDDKGEKISINQDTENKLEQKLVQVFFGFLIALSFFFTQVTSSSKLSENKVENVSK